MPRDPQIDCVVIDYPDRGFVVPMSEVASFHAEEPAADTLGGLWNLGPLLGTQDAPSARAACVLVVRRDDGSRLGFRTWASVRMQRAFEHEVFRLPRLLREAGCSSWVRGVVAEDRESGAEPLRIWISLLHLARSVERTTS
jgi:hypothetical protein